MKIQPINNINLNQSLKTGLKNTSSVLNHNQINTLSNIPTKNYLAFLGGYSLSLKETSDNLTTSQYPADIEQMVQETLKNGNEDKKTLYDVHFEKYKGVLDCYNLEELKEKYPEFNNVVSAYTVEAKPDTPISRFQEGNSKVFESGEDLTLQLIKLYWGKGFSLTDISNYVKENNPGEITNFYYTITKKLNIPMMDRKYAQVLKLSNREYNEKFTKELAQKLKDVRDEKEQKAHGEAVFIPRKPLSETHKKHISQSLIKHYREHPEKIYEMSQRQKEYFEEHPEQKEIMSEALDYAWNKTHDGQTVKKAIVKYARKSNNFSNEDLTLKTDLTPEKRNILKEFWTKNTWARTKFSSTLSDGWEYARFSPSQYMLKDDENRIKVRVAPKKLAHEVYNFVLSKGDGSYPEACIGLLVAYGGDSGLSKIETDKMNKYIKKLDNYIKQYDEIYPLKENNVASAKQLALMQIEEELQYGSRSLPASMREPKKRALLLSAFKMEQSKKPYCKNTPHGRLPVDGIESNDLTNIVQNIAWLANIYNCPEFGNYFSSKMDEFYEKIDSSNFSSMRTLDVVTKILNNI